MREKCGLLIFYTIIAIHVAAAVIPIRNFPLSDYNMFAYISPQFQSVKKLTFVNVYGDTEVDWQRQDYASVGYGSVLLQSFANSPLHPDVRRFLKERIQLQKSTASKKPDAVIVRRTIYLLQEGKLIPQITDIEKIPYDELAN